MLFSCGDHYQKNSMSCLKLISMGLGYMLLISFHLSLRKAETMYPRCSNGKWGGGYTVDRRGVQVGCPCPLEMGIVFLRM